MKRDDKRNSCTLTISVNLFAGRYLERLTTDSVLGATPEDVATHLLIDAMERRRGWVPPEGK